MSVEMLHHYSSYHGSPLSHFLNFHRFQEQQQQQPSIESSGSDCVGGGGGGVGGGGAASPSSVTTAEEYQQMVDPRYRSEPRKSFTIAAILGLNKGGTVEEDAIGGVGEVVNLSMQQGHHHGHRLQQQQQQQQIVSDCRIPAASARGSATGIVGFPTGPVCQQRQGRGLKTMTGSGKKTSKSKRVRTIFTPEQLERLEAEFERQQYMVGPERLYLAHTLQLTEAQVKVWFQNRRIKWRKHHLELTHQRLAVIKQQQLQQQLLNQDNTDTNSSDTDT